MLVGYDVEKNTSPISPRLPSHVHASSAGLVPRCDAGLSPVSKSVTPGVVTSASSLTSDVVSVTGAATVAGASATNPTVSAILNPAPLDATKSVTKTLLRAGLNPGDQVGFWFAVSSDSLTAFVGAQGNSTNPGYVYVYTRSSTRSSLVYSSTIVAPASDNSKYFGYNFFLSGDDQKIFITAMASDITTGLLYQSRRLSSGSYSTPKIIVTASTEMDSGISNKDGTVLFLGSATWNNNTGRVSLAKRTGGDDRWTTTQIATGNTINCGFGAAMTGSADLSTIIVTAPLEATSRGVIYQLVQSGNSWLANRIAGAVDIYSYAGWSVDATPDGSRFAIGMSGGDGSTWLFYRNASTVSGWSFSLLGRGVYRGDQMGQSVAISNDGNTVLSGAPNGYNATQPGYAMAYNVGRGKSAIVAVGQQGLDGFGYSLAMNGAGDFALVDAVTWNVYSGKAYALRALKPFSAVLE